MAGNKSKTEATTELAAFGLMPRMLNLELAAAYVGLSAAAFRRSVDVGHYPAPLKDGRRKQWDRRALDVAVDQRSGLSSPPLSEADQMMRAIDAA